MMNQPATFDRPPITECLVESIKDKSSVRRSNGPPANDTAGDGIDYKGHVEEALPGRDIGEPKDRLAKSDNHSMFGERALKWLLTRSSGHRTDLSDTVVLIGLPRMMP